jgi:hypothetical protein
VSSQRVTADVGGLPVFEIGRQKLDPRPRPDQRHARRVGEQANPDRRVEHDPVAEGSCRIAIHRRSLRRSARPGAAGGAFPNVGIRDHRDPRHLPARRCAVTCVVSSAASAGTGRKPGSPSVATPITAARRSWSGATRMGSTLSSAYLATACLTGWLMKPPTTFAPAGRSTSNPVYAASPRPGTGRNPGARSAAPALGSRPPRRASTSASSSPASRRDRPSISTRRSTALAARPGFRDGFTGAISAPSFTAPSASAPRRCGGSKWRLGRQRQRRAGRATPSR